MKTAPSPEVGIWLRRVLEQFGVSRNALAKAGGIAPRTLRNAEERRHRISRQTAARLLKEVAKRDAFLAHTAPATLKEAAAPQAGWPDNACDLGTLTLPPLVQLRLGAFDARRALFQVELDTQAVRRIVRALEDLLFRGGELPPQAGLSGLHLVLVEKK